MPTRAFPSPHFLDPTRRSTDEPPRRLRARHGAARGDARGRRRRIRHSSRQPRARSVERRRLGQPASAPAREEAAALWRIPSARPRLMASGPSRDARAPTSRGDQPAAPRVRPGRDARAAHRLHRRRERRDVGTDEGRVFRLRARRGRQRSVPAHPLRRRDSRDDAVEPRGSAHDVVVVHAQGRSARVCDAAHRPEQPGAQGDDDRA